MSIDVLLLHDWAAVYSMFIRMKLAGEEFHGREVRVQAKGEEGVPASRARPV